MHTEQQLRWWDTAQYGNGCMKSWLLATLWISWPSFLKNTTTKLDSGVSHNGKKAVESSLWKVLKAPHLHRRRNLVYPPMFEGEIMVFSFHVSSVIFGHFKSPPVAGWCPRLLHSPLLGRGIHRTLGAWKFPQNANSVGASRDPVWKRGTMGATRDFLKCIAISMGIRWDSCDLLRLNYIRFIGMYDMYYVWQSNGIHIPALNQDLLGRNVVPCDFFP